MLQEAWKQPKIIRWSQLLLNSYEKLLKYSLFDRKGTPENQTKTLFFAPFIVVSHGTESDPILNYGNQTALNLWELNWEDFIQTPSRLTAEPANREERERMLKTTVKQGFINHYRGIRISSTGKRFLLENAKIWNIIDSKGKYCGQAATCSHWSLINQ